MASNLVKIHTRTITIFKPPTPFPLTKALSFPSLPFSTHHHHHQHSHISLPSTLLHKSKIPPLSPLCSLSSPTPPNSKEAAIEQAKTCLSTTLEKPLNNLRLTNRLKRLKQPRFRLEIPVIDDSPVALSQLAFEVFQDLPIKRKGSPVNISILWPNITFTEAALKAFQSYPSSSCPVEHLDLSSITNGNTRILNSADVVVFMAPEGSQLAAMKTVADLLYPRPVVIFNPKWVFEDEAELGELSGFVGSFEVIFSFMGLEVQGLLSKRNGVVFKCVRDGVVSGEKWAVLVEEEGELKAVSQFKSRPSIAEVENVLYNLMAINSPVTKSVKFFRDLVLNITGKKDDFPCTRTFKVGSSYNAILFAGISHRRVLRVISGPNSYDFYDFSSNQENLNRNAILPAITFKSLLRVVKQFIVTTSAVLTVGTIVLP